MKSRAVRTSVAKVAPLAILVVGAAIVYSRRSAALRRLPVFEFARTLTYGSETPAILASFSLGRVQWRTITCHVQQTGDAVALLFMIRDGRGNKSVLTFEGGSGVELEVKVADFIDAGRRQVFLKIQNAVRPAICVLDCDGTQIRTIYRGEDSDDSWRTFSLSNVRLVRSKADPKLWTLEEERTWEKGKKMGDWGLCYALRNSDEPEDEGRILVRFLHWDGEAFVLNNSAPTRLVIMDDKAFDKQFH